MQKQFNRMRNGARIHEDSIKANSKQLHYLWRRTSQIPPFFIRANWLCWFNSNWNVNRMCVCVCAIVLIDRNCVLSRLDRSIRPFRLNAKFQLCTVVRGKWTMRNWSLFIEVQPIVAIHFSEKKKKLTSKWDKVAGQRATAWYWHSLHSVLCSHKE